ncbi:MAG TPA: glycosyltransferase family 2 protein, partial [Actinomycetota bacterium]|nr:glycosyltransferase family 2 protein [Actinomycetota bacterium]
MTATEPGGATKAPARSRKRSTPRVIAVVLNWNLADATLECLESLRAVDYPDFEVLVVDNGSDDGSQAAIEAARPDLTVLQTGSNLGYAGGNNAGIQEAIGRGADFVWILNNDTKVEPDALTALIRAATASGEVGIVGSAVLNSLPEAEAARIAGAAFRWNGERLEDVTCPASEDTCPADGHVVDGVAGTSVLLRTAMVKDLGGFEERFFHYWDD